MFINTFSNAEKAEFVGVFGSRVKFDEPLGPYLAYRVGGPADILVLPQKVEELRWLSAWAKSHSIPVHIVGSGTNLLVLDGGIRGIVVSLAGAFNQIIKLGTEASTRTLVRVGSGTPKPALLEWAINESLSGLEFSAGVPGTVGGGIFMNAGTKYGCYGDILQKLELFDFNEGERILDRTQTVFSYRHQNVVTRDTLVTFVTLELKPGDKAAMRAEVDRIIEEREDKQPLDFPSCGSTFKNPEGHSAGRLIEKAGLKGTVVGGAEISLKHANFILNKGNARASDILQLIHIVKTKVKADFNVDLECEVVILGEPAP